MTDDPVVYDSRAAVATLTFNRPDRGNGWTPSLAARYFELLERAAHDEQVRAIVVTGRGRSFCVGADAGVLGDITAAGGHVPNPQRRPETFTASIGKPVIAAINGACAGIGLHAALMCDVRFAAQDAKFSTAYARRGLVAEMGMSWLLPRLVGVGHATDLLLSGRTVLADEAARLGLVNVVVPPDTVLAAAQEYAQQLAELCSPGSMRTIKRQLRDDLTSTLDESYRRAEALVTEAMAGEDLVEGVASWTERRPPKFRPLPGDLGVID